MFMTGLAATILTTTLVPQNKNRGQRVWEAKTSASALAAVRGIRERALDEARAAGPEQTWAGIYRSVGARDALELTLAPRAGFLFEWQGCVLWDRNFGTVADEGETLRLQPALANSQDPSSGVAERLVPVASDTHRYLVDATRMKDFCNAFNSGVLVSGRSFYVRDDAATFARDFPDDARAEHPVIPAPFEDCLLAEPVETRVTEVGPTAWEPLRDDLLRMRATLTIGAGRADGMWDGMALYASGNASSAHLVVAHAGEHASAVQLDDVVRKGAHGRPAVGAWVSTRASTAAVNAPGATGFHSP
jgi:hypothetical protein